jgi:hypothetical protein
MLSLAITVRCVDAVPSLITAAAVLWPNPKKGPWRITCQWANVDGYARLTGVEITSDSYLTLRATDVRDIPLERVANQALKIARDHLSAHNVGPDVPGHVLGGAPVRKRGKSGRASLTNTDLEEVATLYRMGGTEPTKYVAQQLGISRSAAAKRIAKARSPEVGLLEPTTQGRAGGPRPNRKKAKQP